MLLGLSSSFLKYVFSSLANSIHEFRFEEVVKRIELKALVKQFYIYFVCETHETNRLVFYLGNKGFVVHVLGSNQLSDKVLAVSFGYSFTLTVKDICEVIMVLLLGRPDLDKGKHKYS